ncbi:MAG: hypothetical protein A2V66_04745 [Ignavibacteria bacterium RBG_13_36_8]|nr:MAG: hypothetical protein A2V66_04745 [Ignavibacteria bacterium RBG_13_36_8]
MRNNVILSVITIILLITFCKDNRIVEQDTLIKVYVDLAITEETYSNDIDSLTAGRQKIFDKYNVSEDDYKYTFQKFSEDKEYWEDFFNKVYEYLDSLDVKKKII